MFSRESARKSLPCLRRFLAVGSQRLVESQPSRSFRGFGSWNYNYGTETKSSGLVWFVRSISSGCVVLGSGLGVFYCSNSPISRDTNSLFSFAEDSKETTLEESDQDRIRNSKFEEKKPQSFVVGDAYRRRVFFKYEKRIRTQSPPEKVFEYFASVRTPSGEVFMTPADLMRAVVPVFPPSESNRVREGFLRGERVPGELHCTPSAFFLLFDTNGDGLISFAEYMFFVTLLSIPESSFSVAFKMFDLDDNGEIDKDEFDKVMAFMRKQNRPGAQHGKQKTSSVENGGLLQYLFGNDKNDCLKHERFVQFLRDFHNEILKLEFCHYDHKSQGTISAKDFALSLVASADTNHINKLLDRVDEIQSKPQLAEIRITFNEFKQFAELRKKLESFSLAIFSYGEVNGALTKSDFRRAASRVCGVTVTNNVTDIIFHVFDSDCDGSVSMNEFIRVLQRREGEISQQGYRGLISCFINCATNYSSSSSKIQP